MAFSPFLARAIPQRQDNYNTSLSFCQLMKKPWLSARAFSLSVLSPFAPSTTTACLISGLGFGLGSLSNEPTLCYLIRFRRCRTAPRWVFVTPAVRTLARYAIQQLSPLGFEAVGIVCPGRHSALALTDYILPQVMVSVN